jgi:hypothetical protein
MDIRNRHFGPCAFQDLTTEEVTVDTESLLRNLLLFDTSVVQSNRLKEIPRMIELFDYQGLMQLLKSGALQFQPIRALAANVEGQTVSLVLDGSTPTQRPGAFSLTVVGIGEPTSEIAEFLRVVDEVDGLSLNRRNRLADAVEAAIPSLPEDLWQNAALQTHADLDRAPCDVHKAVAKCLIDSSGVLIDPSLVRLSIHRETETGVFVESNLVNELGLDAQSAHNVVGNALLALTRLNVRVAFMQTHTAISGTPENELPFLDSKFDFLFQRNSPDVETSKFRRIVEIAGLPDLSASIEEGELDIDRLLKVRESRECSEFRDWLRNVDQGSEEEATHQMTGLKAKMGVAAESRAGRVIRFGAVTGTGVIPGAGPIAGPLLGVLDSFLLGKLLPRSGPAAFLSRLYPSIFASG